MGFLTPLIHGRYVAGVPPERLRRAVKYACWVLLVAGAGVAAGAQVRASRQATETGGASGQPPAGEGDRRTLSPPRLTARDVRRALGKAAGGDPPVHRTRDDETVVLTVDPGLQAHIEAELQRYGVPSASVVALHPESGRVLAYVGHTLSGRGGLDLPLDPSPPAASVFKLVTAAALIDQDVEPSARVCYRGGASRLLARHLDDVPTDRQCATLQQAVAGSINSVFAKLADRHLDTETLDRYADAFGFGKPLWFSMEGRAGVARIPDRATERLQFARVSAGFWQVQLSPVHGALIAATFANGGRMPAATLVERVVDSAGSVIFQHRSGRGRRVVSARTAAVVGRMMQGTTGPGGTARRAFYDRAGRPFLPGIRVAGKTGTLAGSAPYRGYTWWVGYAPADEPKIAVAALVVNEPRWRIKASYIARETLRHHLR